ncbi:MAG: hypothetical protein ACRD03_03015 [Acidimicrobiales bacterium]
MPDDHLPPFDRLYGRDAMIAPRMAYRLWVTAQFLGDTWRQSEPEDLSGWLPIVARPHAHGRWLDRFIACFDALAARLATGYPADHALPSCTGEELALHFVLDVAADNAANGLVADDEELAALRPGGDAPADFVAARSDLFLDHDVLLLYQRELDGIEDPTGPLALRIDAVNLHPEQWFEPFDAEAG